MNNIRVVDVTLRDGGCVNNFEFGSDNINKILLAQEKAKVEIIEIGYIDESINKSQGKTKFANEKFIENIIDKKTNTEYVAMIDYGKFNIDKLEPRTICGIDGIRLAFHKENRSEAIEIGRKIINKGYRLYIQPMVTLRYSDSELIDFIRLVNDKLYDAAGFYLVDSFGEMRPNDIDRLFNLIDDNLIPTMPLGFHSHNNLQLSYSNVISMLNIPSSRELFVDCSIMGMGKGAGNLNTELLLEYLNMYYGKNYYIEPLLEVIDKVINQIRSEYYWGYAPEYYLSAINHCSPTYAKHYYNKHMLPIEQVSRLLSLIEDEKKISFDVDYAEKLYRKYNGSRSVDDNAVIEALKDKFTEKAVMLIAPGKSVIDSYKVIEEMSKREDVVTIGLNTDLKINDYVLITRKEIYQNLVNTDVNIIVCSNISISDSSNCNILNYEKWIEFDESTHDSSIVIALNLLQICDVKKIFLAGFDGFSIDINDNYYDTSLRYPMSKYEVEKRNLYNKRLIIEKKKNGVDIEFVTKSRYQD